MPTFSCMWCLWISYLEWWTNLAAHIDTAMCFNPELMNKLSVLLHHVLVMNLKSNLKRRQQNCQWTTNCTCTYWDGLFFSLETAVRRTKGRGPFSRSLRLFMSSCRMIKQIEETIKRQRIVVNCIKWVMANPNLSVSILSKSILSFLQPKMRIIGPRERPSWGSRSEQGL